MYWSGCETKAECLAITGDWSGTEFMDEWNVSSSVFSYLGVDAWIFGGVGLAGCVGLVGMIGTTVPAGTAG